MIYTQEDFLSGQELTQLLRFREGQANPQLSPGIDRVKLEVSPEHPMAVWLFDKIAMLMVQRDFVETIEPWTDYSWRCVYNQSPGSMELGISHYTPGGSGYRWHVDHADGMRRILNFMIPLNRVHGGEILWTDEAMPTEVMDLNPENVKWEPGVVKGSLNHIPGRLVLMPAHYPHRVLPSAQERICAHGHVRL